MNQVQQFVTVMHVYMINNRCVLQEQASISHVMNVSDVPLPL
jgi:hypothetical protein